MKRTLETQEQEDNKKARYVIDPNLIKDFKEYLAAFLTSQAEVFCAAVQYGNLEIIKFLLYEGHNINQVASTGYTPLTIAITNNKFEIFQYLLEQNANANIEDPNGFTPLFYIFSNKELNLDVKFDMIDLLLKAGANPFHTIGPISSAKEAINDFIKNYVADYNSTMFIANKKLIAGTKERDFVKLILAKAGDNINQDPNYYPSLLSYAIATKDSNILAKLIATGADVVNNACYWSQISFKILPNQDYECDDNVFGQQALFLYAVEKKDINVLKKLITIGFRADEWDGAEIVYDELPSFLKKVTSENIEFCSYLIQLRIPCTTIYHWLVDLLSDNQTQLAEDLFIDKTSSLKKALKSYNRSKSYCLLKDIILKNPESFEGVRWLLQNSYPIHHEEWKCVKTPEIAEIFIENGFNILNKSITKSKREVGLFELSYEQMLDQYYSWIAVGVDIKDLELLDNFKLIKALDQLVVNPKNKMDEFISGKFNDLISNALPFEKYLLYRMKKMLLKEGISTSFGEYLCTLKQVANATEMSLFNKMINMLEEFQEKCAADEAVLLNHLIGIDSQPLYRLLELSNEGMELNINEKTLDFYAKLLKCTSLIKKLKSETISKEEKLNLIEILKNHTGEYLNIATCTISGPELTFKLIQKDTLCDLENHLKTYAMPKAYREKLAKVLACVKEVKEDSFCEFLLKEHLKILENGYQKPEDEAEEQLLSFEALTFINQEDAILTGQNEHADNLG